MKKIPKQYLLFTLTSLIFWSSYSVDAKIELLESAKPEMTLKEARDLRMHDPDSSLQLLQQHYTYGLANQDTLSAINALMGLAYNYGHQANYKESYDHLWMALALADTAGLTKNKASIYKALGRHYSFYSRRENAIKYLQLSLVITKRLVKEELLPKAALAQNYHAFAATYRELAEPRLGQSYLDSSFMLYEPQLSNIHRSFLDFEQAVIYLESQRYTEAKALLEKILP